MAANEEYVFGAGKARVGDVGGTLTDNANGVSIIQSISVEPSQQEKALYETNWISQYKKAVTFYNADVKIKLDFNDIERDLIRRITGGTLTTGEPVGGVTTDTITVTATSKPQFMRLEIDTQTPDATPRAVKFVFFNVYCLSVPLSFKIDDYASLSLEFMCLPDGSGNVFTVAMDQ